jgi:hypothetical protein
MGSSFLANHFELAALIVDGLIKLFSPLNDLIMNVFQS